MRCAQINRQWAITQEGIAKRGRQTVIGARQDAVAERLNSGRLSLRVAAWVLLGFAAATLGHETQKPPNFSGTWSVLASRSIWYDEGRPVNISVFGERFTAEQTESTLTIAIENERGFKWVYRLDGTVTQNAPPGPDGPQQTTSSVRWSASALIITTAGLVNGVGRQRSETTRVLKLNEDGTLRVEAPWGRNGAMIGSEYSRVRY